MKIIGYSEFVRLLRIGTPDDYEHLAIRADGVYVLEPTQDEKRVLIPEEIAVLTVHPTGNLSEPALHFPCSVDELKQFVELRGLRGYIDPFELVKVLQTGAFMQAQMEASEQGSNYWPIVAGLYGLLAKYRRVIDIEKDFARRDAWRTVLDDLHVLLPSTRPVTPSAAITDETEKPLRLDTRTNWLRIIRALYEKANLPEREAIATLAQIIDSLGFTGPRDDAIRSVLKEARALPSDKLPK
jgi:hypothetical protein